MLNIQKNYMTYIVINDKCKKLVCNLLNKKNTSYT